MRRRVLIVDDFPEVATALSDALTLKGHEVLIADSGPRALEVGLEFRPEVIVCDLGLPGGMDGYELAAAIRSDVDLRDVCLIALSGYDRSDDVERALGAGFDAYLTKPADLHELLALVMHARRA